MAIREVTIDKAPDGRAVAHLVRGDSRTQIIRFVIDRYEGGVDLAGLLWSVKIVNAVGDGDVYCFGTAETVEDDRLMIDWLVHGVATAAAGDTKFALEGVAEADGPVVWRSGAGIIRVREALDAIPCADSERLTALQQLIVYVGGELSGVLAAGQAAEKAAADAEKATGAAVEAAASANLAALEIKGDVNQLKDDLARLESVLSAIQDKINSGAIDEITVNEINNMIVSYLENKTVYEVEV